MNKKIIRKTRCKKVKKLKRKIKYLFSTLKSAKAKIMLNLTKEE